MQTFSKNCLTGQFYIIKSNSCEFCLESFHCIYCSAGLSGLRSGELYEIILGIVLLNWLCSSSLSMCVLVYGFCVYYGMVFMLLICVLIHGIVCIYNTLVSDCAQKYWNIWNAYSQQLFFSFLLKHFLLLYKNQIQETSTRWKVCKLLNKMSTSWSVAYRTRGSCYINVNDEAPIFYVLINENDHISLT